MQTTDRSIFLRRSLLGALASGVLLLAGCAVLQPQTPEQIVTKRANQRWAALVDGDFEKAWSFTQPGYRAVVRQQHYHRTFGAAASWKAAEVNKVTCEANRCTVRIRLTAAVNLPRMRGQQVTTNFEEAWVREDEQWWFYQAF